MPIDNAQAYTCATSLQSLSAVLENACFPQFPSRLKSQGERMGKINMGRVILGGIVAGIVADVLSFLVDGVWLASQWNAGVSALGRPMLAPSEWIWFDVFGLIAGIVTIWIYAAIRPRLGPGVKTAICAGVAVWILGALLPNLTFMCVTGLFSHRLMVGTTFGAFFEVVLGAIAGAAIYKESST
jgi:hypothetical protein